MINDGRMTALEYQLSWWGQSIRKAGEPYYFFCETPLRKVCDGGAAVVDTQMNPGRWRPSG